MERTAKEKMWLLGTGIAAALIALIGFFFFISPQRDDTSTANDQIADVQTQNMGLQGKIAALAAQSKNMARYQHELARARLALPSTADMSSFLRGVQSVAASTSTSVTALTVGEPAALTSAPTAAASTPTAAPSSSASSSSAGPSTGIYTIPITAAVSGTPSAVSTFLTQLQSVQPRAVLVTAIAQSGSTPKATTTTKITGGVVQLQLTMTAFVAPGTAPTTPSATPSASPSGTP